MGKVCPVLMPDEQHHNQRCENVGYVQVRTTRLDDTSPRSQPSEPAKNWCDEQIQYHLRNMALELAWTGEGLRKRRRFLSGSQNGTKHADDSVGKRRRSVLH